MHFPIHPPPLAYSSPPYLSSLSHSLSLTHHLSLSFSLASSHKQPSGQIAGQPKRADHLSTSEYWKPATGAVEHNKSFSYEYIRFRLLQRVLSIVYVCVWVCGCVWVYVCLSPCHHLDAGEINSDAGQPLKLAP